MSNVSRIVPVQETHHGYIGPATILKLDKSGESAHIQITHLPGHPIVWSRITGISNQDFMEGDEVLVIGEDINSLYIIGNLEQSSGSDRLSLNRQSRITMRDGGYAVIDRKNDAEATASGILRVFSKQRELLFEYDSEANKAKVFVRSGSLEFVTQDGDITFNSARDIRIKGQNIEMVGRLGIKMGIADIMGRFGSAVLMGPGKIKLQCPEMNMVSQRGRIVMDEMIYMGKNLLGKVGHLSILGHKAEKVFKIVVEKAENIYTNVKRLSQLKAGRKRTIVESTYHLKANRSILKAKDDFKVNADKIHLG